jgi:hypothetical protein
LQASGSIENHWVEGRKEHREDQEGSSTAMLPPPPPPLLLLLLLLAQTADAIALNADSRDGDENLYGT